MSLARPPVPMRWAAQALATLDAQVQEAEDKGLALREELVKAFGDARADVVGVTTRRQRFARHLRAAQAEAREEIAEIRTYLAWLDGVEEALKADALEAVQTMPDLEFRGASGRKIYTVTRNSTVLKVPMREKSWSKIVSDDDAKIFGVDPIYLKTIEFKVLDTEAVARDLKAGVALDWAELQPATHVCGLFPTKADEEEDDGE